MFGIAKLTSAVATLAAGLLALADTTAEINARLRGRLQLDGPEEAIPPALEARGTVQAPEDGPEAATNGRARRKAARAAE